MKIVGIICEYNPFHNGHQRQLRLIRQMLGEDTAIVCAMSGSFVQRGAPAIFSKSIRAEAAVRCGADLVLELPVNYALSSAEGFASGGVKILGRLCDQLCFGSETGNADNIMSTAQILLSPGFSAALRQQLDNGLSFPAARQKALEQIGADACALTQPNDILAVEYCKAILAQNLSMTPLPILRNGSYHNLTPQPDAPSATSLRLLLQSAQEISPYIPRAAEAVFAGGAIHCLSAGESAMLYRLRTMTDEEFEALPYGSEGLWRKLMQASRSQATLEDILTAVKSKRYTRSRLDRMVMCAFLGIDRQTLSSPPDYTRVLAFNDRGRRILAQHRKHQHFVHTGEPVAHPHWALEQRCEDLYGLFASDGPEPAGQSRRERIFYLK